MKVHFITSDDQCVDAEGADGDSLLRIAQAAGMPLEGTCEGQIIPEERGTGGFGYDPIFLLDGLTQTMAELPEETKNRLSHRARAVQAARPILMKLIDG